MTAEERLVNYQPKILIVGYNDKGEFSSTICTGREDVAAALPNYVDFKFYWLKGSQRGCDYWRNKVDVFTKQKEKEPQKL